MKKITLLVIILSIFLLFNNCTKKEYAKDKTVVEFWHAMGGPLGDALSKMVDEFNDTHPKIHINAVSMGRYQALSQKLMAAIVANTQPDMAQAYESWTAKFIEGDAIVPIQKFIEGENGFSEKEMSDFYPAFLASSTINGAIWSFPFNKSVRVMYYNKDMFYKNGLDVNTPPKTWDEFISVCKILTQDRDGDGKIDQWGTTFATNVWQFENLLLQAGGKIMNDDSTIPLFNSTEGEEALNYLYDLLNKYKVAYLSTGYDGQNDFLASKVGMVEGSSVSLVYLQKGGIPFNIGLAPVPYNRTKNCLISGTNVVIFKNEKDAENAKKQAACWEFIKWFTSPKQTAKWSLMTYYMPVRKSALESENVQQRFSEYPGLKDVFHQLDNALTEPQIELWFETRKFLGERVIEKVLRDQLTSKEALDNVAKKMKKDLNEPEPETESAPEPEPTETVSQRNAVRMAKSYLGYSAFSYTGLIKQLEYEQF
ncbi:MAG: extracellular solute-binding protein, partial [Candidatus Cloacimonetes bacterium]|nr:extracellular solute-binding protein [Candidatus Cloacimonadota bacterium]